MPLDNAHRPLYEVKAGLFKALAHPIRIHVLELLSDGNEHGVTEIQAHTGLESSHLSAHLAVLRQHRVVVSERRASHVYYKVTSDQIAQVLAAARAFLTEVAAAQHDQFQGVDELPELPRTNGGRE